ncbi:hypothetical protein K7X08_010751 [Anisodus acutangulus]|uniref:Uncharacterized protein n=2 Tax=Anisodus TaxID=243963 RepID=A0A9Q1LXG5_9SOLA|nr:hypothetical protein K7X08_010751 [Anisodus acutangulus]KAK4356939.1 hypothetical protein RND71_022549 [Anisodus tanguticus]
MEVAQHRWRLRWSFKNATIIVTLFNMITALFLLHTFFSSSSYTTPSSVERYMKEAEEIRRAMLPVELIKRVKEIQKEANVEPDPVLQKDAKQTAAVDLISRLNNYRSYSDSGSVKVLEEWRKRKMERARQRELEKNGTTI